MTAVLPELTENNEGRKKGNPFIEGEVMLFH